MVAIDSASLSEAWEQSYSKHQNTLFYPSEQVVAFVNRYIRRRTGVDVYSVDFETPPVVLDLGSGAGRHLQFLVEAGYFPIGVELSKVACEQAVLLLRHEGISEENYRIINAPAWPLPLPDSSVDYCVSAATLDSMSRADAIAAVAEVHRVLKPGGLIYIDLIADTVVRDGLKISDNEYLVGEEHEKGTIQTHYDFDSIERLLAGFERVDVRLNQTLTPDGKVLGGRWSAVYKRTDRA